MFSCPLCQKLQADVVHRACIADDDGSPASCLPLSAFFCCGDKKRLLSDKTCEA